MSDDYWIRQAISRMREGGDPDGAAQADAELARLTLTDQPSAILCEWSQDDWEAGTWSAGCGLVWCFEDGGPTENEMKFCPGCGHGLVATPYKDPPDEDEDDITPDQQFAVVDRNGDPCYPDQQSPAPDWTCPDCDCRMAAQVRYCPVCLTRKEAADPKSAPYTPPCCKDAPEWMAVVTCNPGCPRATDKPSGEHQHNDPRAEDQ
jgi:hypothetical protein